MSVWVLARWVRTIRYWLTPTPILSLSLQDQVRPNQGSDSFSSNRYWVA